MDRPRWPMIVAACAGALVIAAAAFFAGRGSAPEHAASGAGDTTASPVDFVGGIPVGVQHTRVGALAAADNYVAAATETALPDPVRYRRLVASVYAPSYRATALREAHEARARAPALVAAYKSGGRKGVAVVAARRLDGFAANTAHVTTWRAGLVWGPSDTPFSQWFLTKTSLRWNGQRWLVSKIDDAQRPAPTPPVRYTDRRSLRSETFDRELNGMTAPIYGAAR
jgi:hypothetical protein